jgi:hypothetical protein
MLRSDLEKAELIDVERGQLTSLLLEFHDVFRGNMGRYIDTGETKPPKCQAMRRVPFAVVQNSQRDAGRGGDSALQQPLDQSSGASPEKRQHIEILCGLQRAYVSDKFSS